MHICNHRIHERYGREVVSLVVLTDDRRPGGAYCLSFGALGLRLSSCFPMVKVLDSGGRWGELEACENPFGLVVLAHLEAQAAATDED